MDSEGGRPSGSCTLDGQWGSERAHWIVRERLASLDRSEGCLGSCLHDLGLASIWKAPWSHSVWICDLGAPPDRAQACSGFSGASSSTHQAIFFEENLPALGVRATALGVRDGGYERC